MKICFIADARSTTAKSWISYFVQAGDEVSIVSSYPCAQDEIPGASIFQFPVALGSLSSVAHDGKVKASTSPGFAKLASELRVGRLSGIAQQLRAFCGPIDVRRKAPFLRKIVGPLQPDLVHAMRLPYEGFLAAEGVRNFPLLISTWGTDFTLFAARHTRLKALTRSAMSRADAIHCDCNRDLELAIGYGFAASKPSRVLPGAGGIQAGSVRIENLDLICKYDIPADVPLIINPRGFRQYVRNDVFFRSIPIVLAEVPDAVFLATGMHGNPVAERWVRELCISRSVRLLPTVSQSELTSLFKICSLSVSPSLHDGTPNSLLEAMAAGCLPVAGDLESLREWIRPDENGLLWDANNPNSVAAAIVRGIKDTTLRRAAAEMNKMMIARRADYATCMATAREFYAEIINSSKQSRTAIPQTRGSLCVASLVS